MSWFKTNPELLCIQWTLISSGSAKWTQPNLVIQLLVWGEDCETPELVIMSTTLISGPFQRLGSIRLSLTTRKERIRKNQERIQAIQQTQIIYENRNSGRRISPPPLGCFKHSPPALSPLSIFTPSPYPSLFTSFNNSLWIISSLVRGKISKINFMLCKLQNFFIFFYLKPNSWDFFSEVS